MKGIKKFITVIESINEFVGRGVSWVTFGLVILVFTDVVMRYAFKTSFVFVQELEWHMFSVIFLVGAGYTLLHDEHVRVDIFYQRMSQKSKAWINLIGTGLFLFPGCYMIIATAIPFVMDSFSVMEGSPDPGGVPFRFLLKSMIPIGFVFVFLQGVSLFLKSLFTVLEMDLDLGNDELSDNEPKTRET
jgi:TRAP-type mannitol/chloroaromatic compound transport system permease small subunit